MSTQRCSLRALLFLPLLLRPRLRKRRKGQQRFTAIGPFRAQRQQGKKKSCGLIQVIRSQTSPAQIAIGRSPDSGTMKFSVTIPANVWLPSGLKLVSTDKKTVISATFRVCVAGRCIADADLTNDQIDRLRAQTEAGNIEYVSAAQTNVSLAISFHGFVEAMDALKREQASLAP
jgi:invasion protein IalB